VGGGKGSIELNKNFALANVDIMWEHKEEEIREILNTFL